MNIEEIEQMLKKVVGIRIMNRVGKDIYLDNLINDFYGTYLVCRYGADARGLGKYEECLATIQDKYFLILAQAD